MKRLYEEFKDMLQRLCNRRMNPESPNEDPKDYKQE